MLIFSRFEIRHLAERVGLEPTSRKATPLFESGSLANSEHLSLLVKITFLAVLVNLILIEINDSMKISMVELDKQADLLSTKKMVIFDLDGTLTKSKANLDKEMAVLLSKLLEKKIVAVMGGGNYPQFEKQFLAYFKCPKERFRNLFILPTSGGRMYQYQAGKWQAIYENTLTGKEKRLILDAFEKAFQDANYTLPKKMYGEIIEDRESQITFSALGQKTPLAKKEKWNKKYDIRPQLKAALEKYLPQFEVRLGGLTSIDVTKKGIDKAYGIRQIKKILSVPIKEMVYVGDALYEGGNDSAVFKTKIDTIQVFDCEETKYLILKILT